MEVIAVFLYVCINDSRLDCVAYLIMMAKYTLGV